MIARGLGLLSLLGLLGLSNACGPRAAWAVEPAGAATFAAAQKALAAGDVAGALSAMEAAIAQEPDSLRFASEYRQAIIKIGKADAYDRAIDFFERLVADHPVSANAWLNYGYTYVDKIPSAGAISQVILANNALTRFSKSIAIRPSWLSLYTRGNSYLYWPKVFGRAPLGVADLEAAVAVSRQEPKRPYHARAYVALGDAYWKTEQPGKARATWEEGRKLFPDEPQLRARLALQGEELEGYISAQLDPNKRVDTDLRELWEAR